MDPDGEPIRLTFNIFQLDAGAFRDSSGGGDDGFANPWIVEIRISMR